MEKANTPRSRVTRSAARQGNTPSTKVEQDENLDHTVAEDIKQNVRKPRLRTESKPTSNGDTTVDHKKIKNIGELSDGNSLDGCESVDSFSSENVRRSPKSNDAKGTSPTISKKSLRTRRSITPGPELESTKKMKRCTSEGKLESMSTPTNRRSGRAKSESKDFVFTPSKRNSMEKERVTSLSESNSKNIHRNSRLRVIDKIMEDNELEESSQDEEESMNLMSLKKQVKETNETINKDSNCLDGISRLNNDETNSLALNAINSDCTEENSAETGLVKDNVNTDLLKYSVDGETKNENTSHERLAKEVDSTLKGDSEETAEVPSNSAHATQDNMNCEPTEQHNFSPNCSLVNLTNNDKTTSDNVEKSNVFVGNNEVHEGNIAKLDNTSSILENDNALKNSEHNTNQSTSDLEKSTKDEEHSLEENNTILNSLNKAENECQGEALAPDSHKSDEVPDKLSILDCNLASSNDITKSGEHCSVVQPESILIPEENNVKSEEEQIDLECSQVVNAVRISLSDSEDNSVTDKKDSSVTTDYHANIENTVNNQELKSADNMSIKICETDSHSIIISETVSLATDDTTGISKPENKGNIDITVSGDRDISNSTVTYIDSDITDNKDAIMVHDKAPKDFESCSTDVLEIKDEDSSSNTIETNAQNPLEGEHFGDQKENSGRINDNSEILQYDIDLNPENKSNQENISNKKHLESVELNIDNSMTGVQFEQHAEDYSENKHIVLHKTNEEDIIIPIHEIDTDSNKNNEYMEHYENENYNEENYIEDDYAETKYEEQTYQDKTSINKDGEDSCDIYKNLSDFGTDGEEKKDGSQSDETASSAIRSGTDDSEEYISSVDYEENENIEENQPSIEEKKYVDDIKINEEKDVKGEGKIFDNSSPMTYDKALAILNKNRVKKIDDEEFFDMFTQELNRVSEESGSDSDIAIVDEYILEPEEPKKPTPKPGIPQENIKQSQKPSVPIQVSQALQVNQHFVGTYNQQMHTPSNPEISQHNHSVQPPHNHPNMTRMNYPQGGMGMYHEYSQEMISVNTPQSQMMYNQFVPPTTNISDPRVFGHHGPPDTYSRAGMFSHPMGPVTDSTAMHSSFKVRNINDITNPQTLNSKTRFMGLEQVPKSLGLEPGPPKAHSGHEEKLDKITSRISASTMTEGYDKEEKAKCQSSTNKDGKSNTPILDLLGLDKKKLELLKKVLGIQKEGKNIDPELSSNQSSTSRKQRHRLRDKVKKKKESEKAIKKLFIQQILGEDSTLVNRMLAGSSTESSSEESALSKRLRNMYKKNKSSDDSSSEGTTSSDDRHREVSVGEKSVVVTVANTMPKKRRRNRALNKFKKTQNSSNDTSPESFNIRKKSKYSSNIFRRFNTQHVVVGNKAKRKMGQGKKQQKEQFIIKSRSGTFTVDPLTTTSQSSESEVLSQDEQSYLKDYKKRMMSKFGKNKLSNMFSEGSFLQARRLNETSSGKKQRKTVAKVKQLKKLPAEVLESLANEKMKNKRPHPDDSGSEGNIEMPRKKRHRSKVRSVAAKQDYIPLVTGGATRFGLSRLDKDGALSAAEKAAKYRTDQLYGSSVKRITILDFKG